MLSLMEQRILTAITQAVSPPQIGDLAQIIYGSDTSSHRRRINTQISNIRGKGYRIVNPRQPRSQIQLGYRFIGLHMDPQQATLRGDKPIVSGPLQFGSQWPGVFIRGESALAYSLALRDAIALRPTDPGAVTLQGLCDLLDSVTTG